MHGKEAAEYDVHSVRSCDWQKVGLLDAVPGAVERSFGLPRTVQAVREKATEAFSDFLMARLKGEPIDPLPKAVDIFGLLSPLDHEDLAASYLQVQHGFVIVPSTVKLSTATYEWVIYNRMSGQKATLQVKSGAAGVDLAKLGKLDCPVFVLVADGARNKSAPKNIKWIRRDSLLEFARKNRNMLSTRIRFYLDWAGL